MSAVTRELELAGACCAWPRTSQKDAWVRTLAQGPIDWDRFLRIIRRHRIWALADHGLHGAGAEAPAEVLQALRVQARKVSQRGLAHLAETLRLQDVLTRAGVTALFLKGEGLSLRLFGMAGLKQSRDIDVLVAPEALGQAMAALEAEGYAAFDPLGLTPAQFAVHCQQAHDVALRHPASGMIVEVHWRLFDNGHFLPGVDAGSPAQDIDVGGPRRLRTLNDDDLIAYLCLHGAQHGWARLKWLAEIGAWLGGRTEAEMEAAMAAAAERGAGRAMGQAMLLSGRLLGLPLPPALEARLRAEPAIRRLEALALAVIAHGGGEAEVPSGSLRAAAILRSHYLLGRGWDFRWAVLARQWRGDWDRIHVPLPPPLHFLYHLIRIPSSLARRLPLRRPGGPGPASGAARTGPGSPPGVRS